MSENIYDFYHELKNFGFCVRRSSWGKNTFARVVYIDGVVEGDDMPGDPPYYYNPGVYAILYMGNKEPQAIKLSVPGGSSYELTECRPFKPKKIKNGFSYRDAKYIPRD